MPFVYRRCQICGHRTELVIACGMGADRCNGDVARPRLPVRLDMHDHCKELCWCTYGGCMAERVSLTTGEVVS